MWWGIEWREAGPNLEGARVADGPMRGACALQHLAGAVVEAGGRVAAQREDRKAAGQGVPECLDRKHPLIVPLLAQERDHVAEYGQPRRRALSHAPPILIQFGGHLCETARVGKAVVHEPVQRL